MISTIGLVEIKAGGVDIATTQLDYSTGKSIVGLNPNSELGNNKYFCTYMSPSINAVTPDIVTFLNEIGVIGNEVANVKAHFNKATVDGIRDQNPQLLTAENTLIVPQSISANRGEIASLSYSIAGLKKDGQTAAKPFIRSAPAIYSFQDFATPLALGTFTFDGTEWDGIEGVSLSFNNSPEFVKGVQYPREGYVLTANPNITITGVDVPTLMTLFAEDSVHDKAISLTLNQFTDGIITETAKVTISGTVGAAVMDSVGGSTGSRLQPSVTMSFNSNRSGALSVTVA